MRHLLAALAALIMITGGANSAPAADRAIVILDASGSMWAQIDGRTRIDIARESLGDVLAGVSPDLELGFMAYGHRTKGDCKDIELMVPPAPGTADQIAKAAAGLSPKGKTPLTDAVRQAADALKYTENKATVILITDGIETCDADPCALASDLAAKGVDLKVNVVGFGLSAADGEKVKCLADNTHGVYVDAQDSDGLKNAIQVAVDQTPAPAPEPTPPPPAPEPPAFNFAPSAVMVEGGDPLLEGAGNIAWEFYKVNADGTQGDWVRTEYGNAYKGAIDPGTYLVNAKLDYAHQTQTVTIEDGKVATPVFDLEAGLIDLRPLDTAGGPVNGSAAVYTEFPDGTSTTSYGEVKSFVPAGTTKIGVTIGSARLEDSITVAAGESASKDLIVSLGHATVTASYGPGEPVTDSVLFVDVFKAKKDLQGNREEVTSGYGPTVELDLPPGDYVAIATYDAVKVEYPFTVTANEAQSFDIALGAGVLAISAENAASIEVQSAKKDLQGNRATFGTTYDNPSNRTLPAGDYHIKVTLADGSTREADATVKIGERTEIAVP